MKAAIIGGQLARRYGLPYRTSNTCAANAVDAQAAYESVFSLWGAVMGGGNLVLHGAGWMEGGLVASFEKFVLDCDLIQMIEAFLTPLAVDNDALGLEAIREVGPGGHFFGAAHTLARYSQAFYAPLISDWRNFQQWTAATQPQAHRRRQPLLRPCSRRNRRSPRDCRGARSLRRRRRWWAGCRRISAGQSDAEAARLGAPGPGAFEVGR
jgi:trimethylamine--corrinoid protein Co-methyltransferase